MNRRAVAASLTILAAFVAGCSSRPAEKPTTASVTPVEQPFRAGTGVVQAVTPAPAPIAAGPRTGSDKVPAAKDSGLQRLRIRMDDGTTSWVDTPGKDFAPGQRVQLSASNEIRKQ
jgi:hypothetical protein